LAKYYNHLVDTSAYTYYLMNYVARETTNAGIIEH